MQDDRYTSVTGGEIVRVTVGKRASCVTLSGQLQKAHRSAEDM